MTIPAFTQKYPNIIVFACAQGGWDAGTGEFVQNYKNSNRTIRGTLQVCDLAVIIFQRFLYCFHVKTLFSANRFYKNKTFLLGLDSPNAKRPSR